MLKKILTFDIESCYFCDIRNFLNLQRKVLLKKDAMLQTGFRLIGILEALYEEDRAKSEIKDRLWQKYGIGNFSDETLKLDINSLIKAGFKIKRGTRKNGYKIHLDKNFVMMKLSHEDVCLLNAIKETVFEFGDYKKVLKLKSFYKKLSDFVCDEYRFELSDFKFFNSVNDKIIEALNDAIENNSFCVVIYNSSVGGNKEAEIFPEKIFMRNDKLYLSCYLKSGKTKIVFRTDNIKSVAMTEKRKETEENADKKVKYVISKSFYENNPVENFENPFNFGKKQVEIETSGEHDFFTVQRLITLGEDCLNINDVKIKEKILKSLKESLELYE